MSSKLQAGTGSFLNDALFTLLLASLLGVMLGLGFSAYGLQHFGSRSQILCRISAGLLVPLVIVRLLGHLQAKRTSYIKTDLALFLLPLILLPCAAKIAGGASLAMTRPLVPAFNTSLVDRNPTQAVINPLTGKPANAKSSLPNPAPPSAMPIGEIFHEGPIVVTSRNYESTYAALFNRPDDYAGRIIKIDGFAFPDNGLPGGQWIAGRLLIVCCPGDGILVGFPAKMPVNFQPAAADVWWQIEGTLETLVIPDQLDLETGSRFAAGDRVPCIVVSNIRPRTMPADPYLYPQ